MRRARRLELALRDLVQQGLVADLQDARGFSTVPLNALEDFRQRLAFRLLGPAARDVPQAVSARRRRGGRGPADLLAARHQVIEDLLGIVEHDESPDHVLQLADVAAPRILQELRGRRGRKLLVPPVLLVEPRQEALSEDEDLLPALAQRRNANLHDVEAVVEVFTELTAGERLLEIAIGRRHDPGVHVDHPVASDAGEAEVLQDVQELGLKGKGKLGDLVEVDRPLVGVPELARLSAVRPGERALFVAEGSDSRSPAGIAAQLTLMKGQLQRREAAWMARTTRSLPTPLSPRIKTVASVSAMFSTIARIDRIAGLPSRSVAYSARYRSPWIVETASPSGRPLSWPGSRSRLTMISGGRGT